MNEPITKNELKEILADALTTLKGDLKEGILTETKMMINDAVEGVMGGIHELQQTLDDAKPSLDLIEKHDMRIETVENRTNILKGVIEKDLNKTVAW